MPKRKAEEPLLEALKRYEERHTQNHGENATEPEPGLKALVKDLRSKPHTERRDLFITAAKEGEFSHYENKEPMPKMYLDSCLRSFGYMDMFENHLQGKYEHDFGYPDGYESGDEAEVEPEAESKPKAKHNHDLRPRKRVKYK